MKKFDLPVDYNKLHWTQKKVVREQYVEEQEGKCFYCGNDLEGSPSKEIIDKKINLKLFPRGFFNNPVHLQHDHKTGFTQGAVHAHCNAVMWQYEGW